MKLHKYSFLTIRNKFDEFRLSMAHIDALPQLTIMALAVGSATALLIVCFRIAIDLPFYLTSLGSAENYEALAPIERTALILGGAILIGGFLHFLPKAKRQMSVSHVIDRTHNHQGNLPFTNWASQFILATFCIISGQSVGREGPAVHLGAGAASQLGKLFKLPRNSLQTLIACGVAAGISASFDTPMAGVIFAMEVILMEYTIVGFVPVILASVVGAAISRGILGEAIMFRLGDSGISNLTELLYILLFGVAIAFCAGIYIKLNIYLLKFEKYPVFLRVCVAGLIAAAASWFVPSIMGLGYDTIEAAMLGTIGAWMLLLIAAVKLIVTPITIGLGVPGGLIGPSLFIGACTGGAAGALASVLFPELGMDPRLYILLGMTGMMAAVVNAPLAALVAVLELSYNPELIFPAMLMIVIACLCTRVIFKLRGIFVEQLIASGRGLELAPATKALRRAGVTSIMDRSFVISESKITRREANTLFESHPNWIVFEKAERFIALSAADLAKHLETLSESEPTEESVSLEEIPGRSFQLAQIAESDSLFEAYKVLEQTGHSAICVIRNTRSLEALIRGIITRDAIHNYYRPKRISNALG